MKKRYLRKEIEIALSIVLVFMSIGVCTIDKIELNIQTLLFAITWFSIMLLIYDVLKKYGKGVIYEEV